MKIYKKLSSIALLTVSLFAISNTLSTPFDPALREKLKKVKKLIFKIAGLRNFKEYQKLVNLKINHLISQREAAGSPTTPKEATALFTSAIISNNTKLAKKLISLKADVNKKFKSPENPHIKITPLSLLIISSVIFEFDPTAFIELLMQNGANPSIKEKFNGVEIDAIKLAKHLRLHKAIRIFKRYGY